MVAIEVILSDSKTKFKLKTVWVSKTGILAVNKHLRGHRIEAVKEDKGYNITHLKTGLNIAPKVYPTKKEAIQVAQKLLRDCPVNTWVFVSEGESVAAILAVYKELNDNHITKVNQAAKEYEEKLIKDSLARSFNPL